MLSCRFIAALWSHAGKGLTSWLLLVILFFLYFFMWYPRSGVVLDCIVFCSLSSFVLFFLNFEFQYLLGFQGKNFFGDM